MNHDTPTHVMPASELHATDAPAPLAIAIAIAPAPSHLREIEGAPQPPEPLVTASLLDPRSVDAGGAPNRLASAFETGAFEDLALSIQLAGGNTQPIVVRALRSDELAPDRLHRYVLISGARRLHACLKHGLQVLAVVRQAASSDRDLIDRLIENHLRAALSPFEFGRQLQVIQEQHPNLSKRALGRLIGEDESIVLKALDIAQLPRPMVECFESPAAIRYSDAKPLKDAFRAAPHAVLQEAERIRSGAPLKPSELVRRIVDASRQAVGAATDSSGDQRGVEPFNTPIAVDGKAVGEVTADKGGKTRVTVEVNLTPQQCEAFSRHIAAFIGKKVLRPPAARGVRTPPVASARKGPVEAASAPVVAATVATDEAAALRGSVA